MVFVAPKLTGDQAIMVIGQAWVQSRKNKRRFIKILHALQRHNCFWLRDAQPVVDSSLAFDEMQSDATARVRFRFTIGQLRYLAPLLGLPHDGVTTPSGDRAPRVEALAMVCRRLSEASKLLIVASEFGRSTSAYNRIMKATVALLYRRHRRHRRHRKTLYFNHQLVNEKNVEYCAAVHAKGAPLRSCWAFIDGTKQYIARPSARNQPHGPYENLQRSVYNGHPRRHCFNWQSVQAPDGIIISIYGPVEGRRHDSTVLSLNGILELMDGDSGDIFAGKVIYEISLIVAANLFARHPASTAHLGTGLTAK